MANLAERARRLNRGMAAGFALLTDPRVPEPLPLLAMLPPGSLVIVRHYDAPDRAALARKFARVCRARRLTLLVAGDLDLAIGLKVGLHLPEWRVRQNNARIRLWHRRTKRALSAAAHSRAALAWAAEIDADLALLSPVFATASHAEARSLGLLHFRSLVQSARLPVWALGGVSLKTLRAVKASGATGIATVGNLTR